jgi:hypothetical protein
MHARPRWGAFCFSIYLLRARSWIHVRIRRSTHRGSASFFCFFSYNDCITANRNGLIPDDEALMLYGDASGLAKTLICAECAYGLQETTFETSGSV